MSHIPLIFGLKLYCVVPENIHTPHVRSLEILKGRGGGSEAKISEGSGGSSVAFFPEGGKQFVMNEMIVNVMVLTIEKGIEINYFPLSLNYTMVANALPIYTARISNIMIGIEKIVTCINFAYYCTAEINFH